MWNKYEINPLINFYIDNFLQLDGSNTCIEMLAERWFPVANLTNKLPVSIFEFHAPGSSACHVSHYSVQTHLAATSFGKLFLHCNLSVCCHSNSKSDVLMQLYEGLNELESNYLFHHLIIIKIIGGKHII